MPANDGAIAAAVSGEEQVIFFSGTMEGKAESARMGAPLLAVILVCASLSSCVLSGVDHPKSDARNEERALIAATTVIEFSVNPIKVYVGEEVTFVSTASSSLPDPVLNFVIFFDSRLSDGITNNTESPYFSATSSDNPSTVTATYTYDHIGNISGSFGTYFSATLYVSDGDTTEKRSIPVYVVENTAPKWLLSLPPLLPYNIADDEFDGRTLALDETTLAIRAQDPDNDSLEIRWDFGDGASSVNYTAPSLEGVLASQSHVWEIDGIPGEGEYEVEYFLNVSVSDGNDHTIWKVTRLLIQIPENNPPVISLSSDGYAVPLEDVVLSANATDLEGDPLTWTFDFGDGTVEVHHSDWSERGSTVWMNVTHSYFLEGTYDARLFVSDALPPNQVSFHNVSKTTRIIVKNNSLPVVSSVNAYPDTPELNLTTGIAYVKLALQVCDSDGDQVYVSWHFGDGSAVAFNVTTGGTSVQTVSQIHGYDSAGQFVVTATITDGRSDELTVTRTLNVTSKNLPPAAQISFEFEGEMLLPNQTLTMVVGISDPELDPIQVSVDFGDGSPLVYLNLTDFVNGTVSFALDHSYSEAGTYTVVLWYTDNMVGALQHNKTSVRYVDVRIQESEKTVVWDWWDYTSLGLFCSVPFVFIAWGWYVHRRHRLLERKGITYDEWQLRKDELADKLLGKSKK